MSRRRLIHQSFSLMLAALVFYGCNTQTAEPTPVSTATPVPLTATFTTTPIPPTATPTSTSTPTPTPTIIVGSVSGLVLYNDGLPAQNLTIILCSITNLEGKTAKFVVTEYSAITDGQGRFTIYGVPEGKYMIYVVTVMKPAIGASGTDTDATTFDVEPGQEVDIGKEVIKR